MSRAARYIEPIPAIDTNGLPCAHVITDPQLAGASRDILHNRIDDQTLRVRVVFHVPFDVNEVTWAVRRINDLGNLVDNLFRLVNYHFEILNLLLQFLNLLLQLFNLSPVSTPLPLSGFGGGNGGFAVKSAIVFRSSVIVF